MPKSMPYTPYNKGQGYGLIANKLHRSENDPSNIIISDQVKNNSLKDVNKTINFSREYKQYANRFEKENPNLIKLDFQEYVKLYKVANEEHISGLEFAQESKYHQEVRNELDNDINNIKGLDQLSLEMFDTLSTNNTMLSDLNESIDSTKEQSYNPQ